MREYIFIHGKNTSLSQAELRAVYGDQVSVQTLDFSIVNSEEELSQADQDRLGGTIKIAQVFSEDPVALLLRDAKNEKILFGLSQYGGHEKISDILMQMKKELKEAGRNARFLNKQFGNISSAQLNKSGVLETGIDMTVCYSKGKSWWGKTIAFQNIDAYSKRDYEKPHRDMKVGMMPPKLAQIMINLACRRGAPTTERTPIYDPFCGLGTTLLESALMGHPVLGSDIKGRLVHNTIQNVEWLGREFGGAVGALHATPLRGNIDESIFQHDATQPFPSGKYPNNISVVTEGYLGPPLLRFPKPEEQVSIFETLNGINTLFFSSISHFITKGFRIVMCFPYFKSGDKRIYYPEEQLKKYAQENEFQIEGQIRSLLYERKDQVVGREIVIFQKI